MASSVPIEILFLILDELKGIKDRLRLLEVCRHWNKALFNKVYWSIELKPEIFLPLAEALQKNPQLKSLVYELRIPDCYEFASDEPRFYNRTLFHEFLESFADNDKELTRWEEKLDIRDVHSWLAVVLISLPNLRQLDLHWNGYLPSIESTLWAVSKIASKTPKEDLPLQHLRSLSARNDDLKANFPSKQFIPFLKLPSLRALHLNGVVDGNDRDVKNSIFNITVDLPRHISPVRELVLLSSNFQRGLLETIAACAHLEHFEYQHHNQVDWGEEYRNYRCRPFHAALLPQKESLRVLRLNDVGVTKRIGEGESESDADLYETDIRESKAQAWFGSLVDFVALKELRMPVRNLLDSTAGKEPYFALSEILPSGLEVLVLTKVDFIEYSMLEGQLRRFLSVREQQFPGLRKITLQTFQMEVISGEEMIWQERNWGAPRRAKTVFADVRSICEEQGVEFSFAHDGDFQVLVNEQVVHDTNEFGGCTED
jgi:hypothetical protein